MILQRRCDGHRLKKNVVLATNRNHRSGLWLAPMTPTHPKDNNHVAMSVYHMRTKPNLIKCLHLACWSPTRRTWNDAIDRGFFATFPGLTTTLINKHLPKSISTAKGRLKNHAKACEAPVNTNPQMLKNKL